MNWFGPARIFVMLVLLGCEFAPDSRVAFAQAISRPSPDNLRDAALASAEAFSAWTLQNRGQTPSRSDLESGLGLARERARAMRQLMEADPEEFIRRAMAEDERASLPGPIRERVEQRLKLRGFFGVYCYLPTDAANGNDAAAGHGGGYRYEVRAGGRTYAAHVFGRWKDQRTVLEADIEGVVLDDAIAIGDSLTPEEQAAAGSPVIESAPTTSSANTVLYLIARFSDQGSDPISESTALSQMTVVSNFWMNNSYGTVSVRGRAHPEQPADVVFITLPQPASYASTYNSSFGSLLADARNAASTLGYNYLDYNLDVVVTTSSGFSYAGRAYVGSQGAHLVAGYTSLRTAGHELGHNLGLNHANYWRTDSTAPFGKDSVPGGYCADTLNAEWVEYGHYFSIMSAQSGGEMDDATKPHYAAAEKARLGWLSGNRVQYVSASGTYRLYRHDHAGVTNDPRGIRIEVPASDYTGNARRYWLNYRYASWNTAASWYRNGVQLDVCRTTYGSDGATLLDLSPFSSDAASPFFDPSNKPSSWWTLDNSDKKDGALVVGRTYSDRDAGIHLTPVATGNSGVNQEFVDVVINLGSFANDFAPVISAFTASTNRIGTGQNVTFNVSASDPDGDPLAFAWNFDDGQVWTASGLNAGAATKSWGSTGQYRVLVTVSDMKGGVTSDSIVVTVGAPANSRQILGRVLWAGLPVSGARVYTTVGSTTYQAFTETDGSYALTDLSSTENYTLNCRAEALTFTAQFQNPVSVASGNAYGLDFYANESLPVPGGGDVFAISGQVSDGSSGVPNVEVSADGLLAVTDASGNYTISNLVNGTYTLTARKDAWSFTPASHVVTINGADDTGRNFTRAGSFVLSGRFYNVNAGSSAPAPRVYLSNGRYVTATRQGSGANRYWAYSLTNVPAGTFTLSAELSGYSLTSTNYANPLVVDASRAGLDFLGTTSAASAAISGRITELGLPLSGITVQAGVGGLTIGAGVTDTDGFFRLSQLTNGTYALLPTGAGYTFSPTSRTVTSGPSSGNDFAALGTNLAPVIASVVADPNPVTGASSLGTLTVSASGVPPLNYAWSVLTAPAPAAFGTNNGPGAATTTVGFQATGSHGLRVKVSDARGFSSISNLTIAVNSGAGQMVVRPYEIRVANGELANFNAAAWSEQGSPISVTPIWSVSGGGTITSGGVFAASAPGGPFNVIATTGDLSATGSVWVVGDFIPTVSIQGLDLAASEAGSDSAAIRVSRNGGTNSPLTVRFAVGGTAAFPDDYSVSGADEYTATLATVIFAAGESNADLIFAPENDFIAEGSEAISLTLLDDAAYLRGSTATNVMTIADDDPQALVVSTNWLLVPEGLGGGFNVLLLNQPPGNVAVTSARAAGDPSLSVAAGASLVFSPANWQLPQTVSLAAAEDPDAANGSATFTVQSAGLNSQTVTATEIENDVQFLFVSTNSLVVLEGGTNSLLLSLNAQPTGDLLVSVALGGSTNLALAVPSSLVFTTNNWNVPRPVAVAALSDGNLANGQGSLTFAATGLTNVVVAVIEIDTSVLALRVSTNALSVAEGATNSLTVQLTAEPLDEIVVDLTVTGDPGLVLLTPSWLNFTPGDWNIPQVVSFTAVADADAATELAVLHLVPSDLDTVLIPVNSVDDETLGLALSTNALTIAEGETGVVQVRLTAQPTNDITVTTTLQSGDSDLTVILGGGLTFTTADWDTAQSLVFQAAPDADAVNGSASFTIAAAGLADLVLTVSELDTNPALPLVTVTVSEHASEWGVVPGTFMVSRTGDTNVPLTVWFTLSGSASNGADYATVNSPFLVPAGSNSTPIVITPIADALAEGEETIEVSLLPDATYALTNSPNAVLTLHDLPVDQWRFSHFTAAELLDPSTSGDAADPDGDGIVNLLEYALGLNPRGADAGGAPFATITTERLTLHYRQSEEAVDVTFTPEVRSLLESGLWTASGLSEIGRLDLGNYWQVSVQDSTFTTNSPARFMRLKVTRP